MKSYKVIIALLLVCISIMNNAMHKTLVEQCEIIRPFFSDVSEIETIKVVMDKIETEKLGYDDYSKRTGLIWSDVLVKTSGQPEIVQEFKTTKVTQVGQSLVAHEPQSILNYPAAKAIVCNTIFPRMFKVIAAWTQLPENIYVQIFFQRCSTSEPMDWHQDPGEDYNPQANYSLVLMLSEQDDPKYGWSGGEFKIRPGLPEDKYNEADVETIMPHFNQGIIFNNQLNSHAATEVTTKLEKAKRDIIVIPINLTKLSVKKDL